jgi:Ca-activated chloride channel family protein
MTLLRRPLFLAGLLLATTSLSLTTAAQQQERFRFKSGIELVNITATVTGGDGRFISGLRKEDFTVYDDDKPQEITHFSSERVPVSLGILLDASGSMRDDKMSAARAAINHFVNDLLGDDDQLFFMDFNERPHLDQSWTSDRRAITRAMAAVDPVGGTALYDAIAEALPIAAEGKHGKKALLVISDGNDSESRIGAGELRQAIRESEVLVYALGIDGLAKASTSKKQKAPSPPPTGGRPRGGFPFPGGGRGGFPPVFRQLLTRAGAGDDSVNADALRRITDDTGGRTEIIHDLRDMDDTTARIADELSRQYSLGYTSPGLRDGKWHSIRVEVKDATATVRARKGYISS